MGAIDDLRAAERGFLATGDERHLDQAEALVEAGLREASFAPATRLWLRLQRYDRAGDDHHLDATVDACRTGSWRDPALAEVAVAVLLRRWARDGDAADLDRAIGMPGAVGMTTTDPSSGQDLPLWLTPAWRAADLSSAYLERSRLTAAAQDDLLTARDILRGAIRGAPEPAIRALAERHLAACEQELYLRSGRRRLLDQAIRRYERVLTMAGTHSVAGPMLATELGTALQDRFAEDADPGDIDRAVALASGAVAEATASGASRPDLACHLVNLGTALSTRYEQEGDPDDLDRALLSWSRALDAVAATSAYRPAFLDRLALGLIMRWEHGGGGKEDLDAAIGYGREAARDGAAAPDAAVYACHLADALEHRWELHRDPADLHEAVRAFAAAMSSLPGDSASGADLACNFAHTLLARYQEMGDADDLAAALAALSRVPAAGLPRSQRAALAAVTARALSMRYEAAGDPADLAGAITAGRRGLAGVETTATTRNSRTARLAHLLYLRYASRGRRRDLDEAIMLVRRVADVTGGSREPSPDQLSQLSGYLASRHERDGDPADQDAAIQFSRRARETDRRDEEPSVAANLASVLHGRFSAHGALDDLDEAIARNREAVARLAPTAPAYRAILSNLGISLQDCYIYRDDDTALDEAIALHERVVIACPPSSPDRAGYLGTLAAAVALRFERDHQAADLDQVLSLGEQALACLGPRAPERTTLLGSLASARHLHARNTTRSADFDSAIATYRAALRRMRDTSPMRPLMLGGYARALGDRPAGRGRAMVLRAFHTALTATGQAPLVRLDVASDLGEWALRNGLWDQAAEAYRAAADARRTLFGTQLSRAYRNTWLTHAQDITAAEAAAWAHCGQPRQAACALDAGRALALAEAVDARTITSRLRGQGHDELAARYERVTLAFARAATLAGPIPGGVIGTHAVGQAKRLASPLGEESDGEG